MRVLEANGNKMYMLVEKLLEVSHRKIRLVKCYMLIKEAPFCWTQYFL